MPSTNVQLVQRLYDAFAAGDLPGALACMSPDIVWLQAEGNPWADGNPTSDPKPWRRASSPGASASSTGSR